MIPSPTIGWIESPVVTSQRYVPLDKGDTFFKRTRSPSDAKSCGEKKKKKERKTTSWLSEQIDMMCKHDLIHTFT